VSWWQYSKDRFSSPEKNGKKINMFTGIIEQIGEVRNITKEEQNVHFTIQADFTNELKVDQSVAHNGCCLTVVSISENQYVVTAIHETLLKTNLGSWKIGTQVNLERCLQYNGRLDGHIVQGHVDTTAMCTSIEDQEGSWKYTFEYKTDDLTVEKGSIAINGTSLTVVDSENGFFSVCIIPYTFEHTNFKDLKIGDHVNLEFDILGKYVAKWMSLK
jgi:riboflavin synthase